MSIGRHRLPLNALRAFEAVARGGSITAGAAALRITQSAVSRHVAKLEAEVGRKLFDRLARGIALTEAGLVLYETVARAFDDMTGALERVRPEGLLRLHVPASFLQAVALPLIQEFRRAHPDIPLAVVSTNGTGMPTVEADVLIVFDADGLEVRGARQLWSIRLVPSAAPGLVAEGTTLAGVLKRRDLLDVKVESRPSRHLWQQVAAESGQPEPPDSGLTFETAALAAAYAATGGGVVLLDPIMFRRDIEARNLVPLVTQTFASGFRYHLIVRPGAPPAARRLVDWLERRLIKRVAADQDCIAVDEGG